MNDKLREALAIVEKYGMKGDVIYKEIEALAASKQEPKAQAGPEVVAWPPAEDQPITLGTYLGAVEAIAKKDAALDACVEALKECEWIMAEHMSGNGLFAVRVGIARAAITQAEGALK